MFLQSIFFSIAKLHISIQLDTVQKYLFTVKHFLNKQMEELCISNEESFADEEIISTSLRFLNKVKIKKLRIEMVNSDNTLMTKLKTVTKFARKISGTKKRSFIINNVSCEQLFLSIVIYILTIF